VLWCGFILYGSFIPFRFTTSPEVVRAKLADVRLLPFEQGRKAFSTSDVVGNVLLFVPFGFLAADTAPGVRGGFRRLSAMALPVGAGALLATGIEIGQLFAPGRTAAGVDVLANTLGTLVGSGLAMRRARRVRDAGLGERVGRRLMAEPVLLAGLLVAIVLAADAFYPLHVAIDPGTVGGNLRRARWVPFSRPWTGFWGDALVDHGLMPAFLAALGRAALAGRVPARAASVLAWLGTVAYCLGLELGKVFFVGRAPLLDNVVVAAAGAAAGVTLLPRWAASCARRGRGGRALVVLAGGLLAYAALTPFRFRLDAGWAARRLGGIPWMPLASYYGAQLPAALFDLWTKLVLAGFFGFAVAAAGGTGGAGQEGGPASPGQARRSLVAGLVAGLVLESAQLFLRQRLPSLDDVAIIAAGAWLGAVVHRRFAGARARPGTTGPAGARARPGGGH
jgi:VanZ family protein